MSVVVVGLDIGGANVKAAHPDGKAMSVPFALWREPQRLAAVLAELMKSWPDMDRLAVTMTGELCDCFESKRQGVNAILDAVETAAADLPIHVWQTTGQFTDVASARQQPLLTAAANWLALAAYVGRLAPEGPALLVDIGSTTTDIIPLLDGQPVPQGRTDTERLHCSELVYTGALRTPVCALLGSAVLAELFATTLDVYLLLGLVPESNACHTADGRAATKPLAHARLARMLGGDAETCTLEEALSLAREAAAVQTSILQHAIRRVSRTLPAAPRKVILSGVGEFLAQKALLREHVSEEHFVPLSHHLGPSCSAAACAHAVAVLARERLHD